MAGIAIGRGATVTVDDNKGKSVPANQRTGGIAIGQSATTNTVVNAIAIGSGTSADGHKPPRLSVVTHIRVAIIQLLLAIAPAFVSSMVLRLVMKRGQALMRMELL